MTEAEAHYLIKLLRPTAKFGVYSHTDDFLPLEAQIGKGFSYYNLYDENINANLLETRKGIILLSNSYLSSSAYNILLAWLFERRQNNSSDGINSLVRYNIKKFFAEQLLHYHNNVFSRAIFLETLLYEEEQMRPVIAAAETMEEWKTVANDIATVMGNLIMFHETGHYYHKFLFNQYEDLMNHYGEVTIPFLADVANTGVSDTFIEEIRCDIFSILICLFQNQDNSAAQTFILRAAVAGYHVFALLWSLKKSAQDTATAHQKQPDDIQLISFEKSSQEYRYTIDIEKDMIRRAELVMSFCERLAADRQIELYGEEGIMPLEKGTLEYFLHYLNVIMDTEQVHQRSIARLMAESLHHHPDGLQYLYLHSKVFKSERPLTL